MVAVNKTAKAILSILLLTLKCINFTAAQNVGIGNTNPPYPLSFASTHGDKISFFGNSGAHYGIGIQSNRLQIHTDAAASDIVFGFGSSNVFTEKMRISGIGTVRIEGPTTPGFIPALSIGGYGDVWVDAPGTVAGRFIIAENGKTGIGVVSPQQRLSVANGMNIDQNNNNSGSIDNNVLRFGSESGEAIGSPRVFGSSNLYGLDFYTASVKRMFITNTGDVVYGDGTTEKVRIKSNGALTIEGNTGSPKQILQSNGNASPAWKTIGSVIETHYRYPPFLMFGEGLLTPGGTIVFTALTTPVTVTTKSRLIISASIAGSNGGCVGCGDRRASIDIRVNGNEANPGAFSGVCWFTNTNGSTTEGNITNFFYDVNPGTYTIEFIAQGLVGGDIAFNSRYSTIIVLPID